MDRDHMGETEVDMETETMEIDKVLEEEDTILIRETIETIENVVQAEVEAEVIKKDLDKEAIVTTAGDNFRHHYFISLNNIRLNIICYNI
jgi:hypothetical protein